MITSIAQARVTPNRASRGGQVVRTFPHASAHHGYASAAQAQIERITLSGTSTGQVLTIAIVIASLGLSASYSYTTTGVATGDERDAMEADILADGAGIGQLVIAAKEGAASIDLTCRYPGAAMTVTVSGTGIATATQTAAGTVQAFTHGRAYVVQSWQSVDGSSLPELATSGALAGPVLDVVLTHDAVGAYTVFAGGVKPGGVLLGANVSSAGGASVADTGANFKTAAEAAIPGSVVTVTVNGGDAECSWALPVGHAVLTVNANASGGSAAATADVSSAGDAVPEQVWICLTQADGSVDTDGNPPTTTDGDAGPNFLIGGAHFTTVTSDAPAFGGVVWVESTPGSDAGALYGTPSPSRFPLLGAHGVGTVPNDSTLAIIAKEI